MRHPRAKIGAFFALIGAGCGGSIDRHDGALRVEVIEAPSHATEVEVAVTSGEHTWTARESLQLDPVFDRFDAVPAGEANVDVSLFAGAQLLAKRRDLAVTIVEGQTTEVEVMFGLGRGVHVLEPPERASHLITTGRPIPIAVEMNDPDVPLELRVEANGANVPVTVVDLQWIAEVDPEAVLRDVVLPASIEIQISACQPGSDQLCERIVRSVEVHRRLWSIELRGARRASPPAVDLSLDRVVIGDDTGWIHLAKLSDGSLIREVALAPPLIRPIAIGAGRAFAAAGSEAWIVELSTGTVAHSRIDLGASDPTGAVFDGQSFLIGAGRRLLAIDPLSGVITERALLPDRIRATPLADARGVVAVDIQGNVIALDPAGAEQFRAGAGDLVYATPLRDGTGVWIATARGRLLHFDAAGRALGAPLELQSPVAHAPILSGSRVVVAAGEKLVFAEGATLIEQRFGQGITGAPALWSNDQIIVGLADGRVSIAGGETRIVSRVGQTAYAPIPLPGERVLVAGSHGFLELLSAEVQR